jgi:hypothetical protein
MLRKLINTSTNFFFISRFKHSHSIYNILTKSLLIDNSLKKDLEMAQKRKLLNAKAKAKSKYNDAKEEFNYFQSIEMSESHNIQPYIRKKK